MSYKNELQGNNADLQLALDKVRNLPEKQTITDLMPERSNSAGAEQILEGYQGVDSEGALITGSMKNNGAVSSTLNAGGSYTVPEGYHDGNGKVTANSLASQTSGTATAADIASGLTAWVDGEKLTGTFTKLNVQTGTFKGNHSKRITISGINGNPIYFTCVIVGDDTDSGNSRPIFGVHYFNSTCTMTSVKTSSSSVLPYNARGSLSYSSSGKTITLSSGDGYSMFAENRTYQYILFY